MIVVREQEPCTSSNANPKSLFIYCRKGFFVVSFFNVALCRKQLTGDLCVPRSNTQLGV
jgi:hypothetical protein